MQLVVHLETTDLLHFEEQIVEEHRVRVQMDERVGEAARYLAIHRLQELAIELRREDPGRVLLQAGDGAGRPKLILGVIVAAMIQGDVLPSLPR